MLSIEAIEELGVYFTLLLVTPLPEDWSKISTEVKRLKRVSIQFFKHGSLVTELVPFLVYNVQQAFKYHYNSLNGFEQELLIALFGKSNFHDALSTLGVSACGEATVLLLSEAAEELKEAVALLEKIFSEKGSIVKKSVNDENLFVSFWAPLLEELGFKSMNAQYHRILELVKERIATSYL